MHAIRFAAVLSALALAASCGGIGNVTGGPQAAAWTRAAPPASKAPSAHHLYVAQGFYGTSAIYRFPLRSDGLPDKKPDGELKLGFPFPGSIAIGPDGDLYVSSAGSGSGCGQQCFVDVFAPGALGNAKPVRVLYVPQTPVYLAVDERGYLDVSTHPGWRDPVTNVYAPGAKGNDAPLDAIVTHGNNALAAHRGIVYIQTLPLGLGIEGASELRRSQPPVYYTYGDNYSADGIAAADGQLYAQFFMRKKSGYELATAVYRIATPGPPVRTIVGTGCRVSRNGGALGYGLALYQKYLFEGCVGAGGSAGEVLVYDSTKDGPQAPIVTLPGGDAGLAIGP